MRDIFDFCRLRFMVILCKEGETHISLSSRNNWHNSVNSDFYIIEKGVYHKQLKDKYFQLCRSIGK